MLAALLKILNEFRRAVPGPQTANDIAGGVPFEVGGQLFTVQYDVADGTSDVLIIKASLGLAPEGQELETYELLLRSNLLLAGNFGPMFGMDLEHPGVLMILTLPISAINAAAFQDAMLRMADASKVWRETRGFTLAVEEPAEAPPEPASAKQAPLSAAFGKPKP